jgi:ubiquinone/menaquinone biosynthesis C-methylase UbiE
MTEQEKAAETCARIKPKARKSIHKAILQWFQTQQRGKVLDAPAGYGHLSLKLKEMGYDVTAGEIEPEIFAVQDVRCIYTNLNTYIDAPDNAFDYVCCVDGLERMTDPYESVQEFVRVLKPGGWSLLYSELHEYRKTLQVPVEGLLHQTCQLRMILKRRGESFQFP